MKYAEAVGVMGLPVVVVVGKEDDISSIDAEKEEFAKLKEIYNVAGSENNCRLVIGNGGYRFYAEDA